MPPRGARAKAGNLSPQTRSKVSATYDSQPPRPVPRFTTAASLLAVILTPSTTCADRQAEIRLFMKGDHVFQKHCAECHGKSGRGDGALAADAVIKPRNFRSGIFKFRSTPLGFLPTNADLTRTIRTGVAGTMMPSFDHLTAAETTAVIAYIKGLSRRWKDPERMTEPIAPPALPAWLGDPAQAKPHVTAGKASFANHCAACHGATGNGDGPASQGLQDAWGHPVVPASLGGPHYRSGPTPADLFRTIAMGLDGTPMTGHLNTLGADRIWELVAYIRTLPPTSPPPP